MAFTQSIFKKQKKAKVVNHFRFCQLLSPIDMYYGGNCFAYSVLFHDFILAHHKLDKPINYKPLAESLNCYPITLRRKLQDYQNISRNPIKELTSAENQLTNRAMNLFGISCYIAENIQALRGSKKDNFFSFLEYSDFNQKILGQYLSHETVIYQPNHTEIHFFCSITGAHIIRLNENFNSESINDIVELQKELTKAMGGLFLRLGIIKLDTNDIFFKLESLKIDKNRNSYNRYILDNGIDIKSRVKHMTNQIKQYEATQKAKDNFLPALNPAYRR